MSSVYSPDLEGIVVGTTAISHVDGEAGTLSYRGVDINTWIRKPFAEVVWNLLFGSQGSEADIQRLHRFLTRHSELRSEEIALLKSLPPDLHPMLMLQATIPTLPANRIISEQDFDATVAHGLLIAARMPALIAAWYRLQSGLEPIGNNDSLDFHEDFLTRFLGHAPSQQQIDTLTVTQILQLEHGYNASTFAGRVCASTQAPIPSILTASVATLFGVLHGGADQAALEMALHLGNPDRAKEFVAQTLARGERIMGMGHREYRTVDPRARVLKPMAEALCRGGEHETLIATLLAVEEACQELFAERGKLIHANVEYYKGAVFQALGIPPRFFTALFAMARVYGYLAHTIEFQQQPRLIRPRACYVAAAV